MRHSISFTLLLYDTCTQKLWNSGLFLCYDRATPNLCLMSLDEAACPQVQCSADRNQLNEGCDFTGSYSRECTQLAFNHACMLYSTKQLVLVSSYFQCVIPLFQLGEPNGQKTVTITSGVDVQELMDYFDENNLCFPSNVILRPVTCAGIVSTGCHVSKQTDILMHITLHKLLWPKVYAMTILNVK